MPHRLEEYGFVKWDGTYAKERYHVHNPNTNKIMTFVWPNAGNMDLSERGDDSKEYTGKVYVRMIEQLPIFMHYKRENVSIKEFIKLFGDGCKRQLNWREEYEYPSQYYNGLSRIKRAYPRNMEEVVHDVTNQKINDWKIYATHLMKTDAIKTAFYKYFNDLTPEQQARFVVNTDTTFMI